MYIFIFGVNKISKNFTNKDIEKMLKEFANKL